MKGCRGTEVGSYMTRTDSWLKTTNPREITFGLISFVSNIDLVHIIIPRDKHGLHNNWIRCGQIEEIADAFSNESLDVTRVAFPTIKLGRRRISCSG